MHSGGSCSPGARRWPQNCREECTLVGPLVMHRKCLAMKTWLADEQDACRELLVLADVMLPLISVLQVG